MYGEVSQIFEDYAGEAIDEIEEYYDNLIKDPIEELKKVTSWVPDPEDYWPFGFAQIAQT